MEIVTVVTAFLSPFLPHLLKLGKPIAEGAGKKLGANLADGSWEKAKRLWGKLSPKVAAKPLAQGAAQALAEDEQDEDAKDTFIKQLQKILDAHPDLAQAIAQEMETDQEMISEVVNITQTVTGDKNIVIGQASGSVNITQS